MIVYLTTILPILLPFVAVMYVWPRLVFYKFLTKKSLYFKLFFCICLMFFIVSAFVILFSLANAPTQHVFYLFFGVTYVGVLAIWIYEHTVLAKKKFKQFFLDFTLEIKTTFINWCKSLVSVKRIPEYIINVIIIAILAYLWFHFSSWVYNHGGFGFSDMSTHYYWASALLQGKVFVEGVYPFGMHSLMYVINILCGQDMFIINLFLCHISNFLVFVAIYWFLKNILKNKISVLLVLLAVVLMLNFVITFSIDNRMVFDGFHRLRYTLPEETILFAAFVAPISVMGIMLDIDISKKSKISYCDGIFLCRQNKTKSTFTFKQEFANNKANYLLLLACIGASVAVHFYVTLFIAMFCVCMFCVCVRHCTVPKFLNYVWVVAVGFVVGLLPLVIGFLVTGEVAYPLQWGADLSAGGVGKESATTTSAGLITLSKQGDFSGAIAKGFSNFYSQVFYNLYCHEKLNNMDWLPIVAIVVLSVNIFFVLFLLIRRKATYNYLFIATTCVVITLLFAGESIGLPRLLESYRLVIPLYIMHFSTMLIIVDYFSYKFFNKFSLTV